VEYVGAGGSNSEGGRDSSNLDVACFELKFSASHPSDCLFAEPDGCEISVKKSSDGCESPLFPCLTPLISLFEQERRGQIIPDTLEELTRRSDTGMRLVVVIKMTLA
jgi:hypothetical protein